MAGPNVAGRPRILHNALQVELLDGWQLRHRADLRAGEVQLLKHRERAGERSDMRDMQ